MLRKEDTLRHIGRIYLTDAALVVGLKFCDPFISMPQLYVPAIHVLPGMLFSFFVVLSPKLVAIYDRPNLRCTPDSPAPHADVP
jgi:hypothetical protein